MEHELEMARQEREDLEKINEELNRMVFEMQESDRKKQNMIRKYQEQNKRIVLSSTNNEMKSEIEKLNESVALQPMSYRQYSHSDNPNNPFQDDDSDESDWDDVDADDDGSDDEERFELVAADKRQFKQSLAQIEKDLHLEHGLEALALDEEEIEKLQQSHYNKQDTLDKLKMFAKAVDERERQKMASMAIQEEEGDQEAMDDEESSEWDEDIENANHDKSGQELDQMISPDLVAGMDELQAMPPINPNLKSSNTIDALISDCDLVSVGMQESEARKILQDLMNLKSEISTPIVLQEEHRLNEGTPSNLTALQTFQNTHKMYHSMESLKGMDQEQEEEAMQRAQDHVFKAESKKNFKKQSNMNTRKHSDNFSDIFPNYSFASKHQFPLKETPGSLMNLHGVFADKQELESMVSHQIELKLQQTQLEAAMTKMELLDELKLEVSIVDPAIDDRRPSKNDFGMPRISTIIEPMNLDQLADELQND